MMCTSFEEGKFDFGVVSGVNSFGVMPSLLKGGGGTVLRKERSRRREGRVINQANNQGWCLLSVPSLSYIIARGNCQ